MQADPVLPSPKPQRHPDWQARLVAYLHAARLQPFAYGRHDCCLFAADAVAAMTGIDIAAPWRGRYTTLRGGIRVLRRSGYRDHVALAAAWFPEVPAFSAQPGDLAVIATEAGPALGVVQGEAVYVLGPQGLGLVSLLSVTRAFRIR